MQLSKLRKIYQLKNIERANSVKTRNKTDKRKESPAEHSWSCLLLADYFLNLEENKNLDRLKVYELLMYHDLVEIETDDVCISKQDKETKLSKQEKEALAAEKLKGEIPDTLKEKFYSLFQEYEENKTPEAKFANAIDKLDPFLHELDYKEDWKGWSEEFVRRKKEKYFEGFPAIKEVFEQAMSFANENSFFEQ